MSHIEENVSRNPVASASKSLTSAEANYSHLKKEDLALVFDTKIFYCYLHGLQFKLLMEHKPLEAIFGGKTGLLAS